MELVSEPSAWTVHLQDGSTARVRAHGYRKQGADVVFVVLIRGEPSHEVAVARFPVVVVDHVVGGPGLSPPAPDDDALRTTPTTRLVDAHRRFDTVAAFDPATGTLTPFARPAGHGTSDGWYDTLDNTAVVFYVHEHQLWLFVGGRTSPTPPEPNASRPPEPVVATEVDDEPAQRA